MKIIVETETEDDYEQVTRLHIAVFNEDAKAKLVEKVRKTPIYVSNLSLVAKYENRIMGARKQLWMADASVIIVGCWIPIPGREDIRLVRDVTMAMEHIVLAAVNEGFGTCWIGASSQRRVNALRSLLRIPPEVGINASITIGYSAAPPRQKETKKIEEIVCYESYK